MDKQKIVDCLNEVLEHELAGVVRYTHYAFMVFGHNRIPICGWLRAQAKESLGHADEIGELITSFDGHPSLKIGKLLESDNHRVNEILTESLHHEKIQVELYKKLLKMAGDSVLVEEFARKMIYEEELHIAEVQKMIKDPNK
ncbi:MAG: bacterioferritin [Bdellovibrio sp.]|nr:bacterioferritin [Bdellovibrio sp.]